MDKQTCSVVHKLLGNLKEAAHIEKVNCKPLVISPLNLVLKSNGSPRLDVLQLTKSEFSRKAYFCKLDLSNGYFHLFIRPEDRKYFGFSFDNQYFVFSSLCFGLQGCP